MPDQVLVSFKDVPRVGQQGILLRMQFPDKMTVQHAAAIVGLKPSEFVRTAVIMAARKIVEEYEKDKKP